MSEKFRSDGAGTFYFACTGLTFATWQISFNLGAHGTVFYTDFFSIWLVSLAAFRASFILGGRPNNGRYFTWWGVILLLLPSIVMALACL